MKTMRVKNAPLASQKNQNISVLVVDEHELVRRGIGAMLNDAGGFEIVAEADYDGAAAAMKEHRPNVIVLDISLRASVGSRLVEQLAGDPATKVLVVDLSGDSLFATKAIKAGAKGYVTKETQGELASALRRIHEGKLAVSDDVAQQMVALLTNTKGKSEEPMDDLSRREYEVAELIGKGCATSEIAKNLDMSVKTVETHKAHIKKKLGVATASQLGRYCVTHFESRANAR